MLLIGGCYEEPIVERVAIEIDSKLVKIETTTTINCVGGSESDPPDPARQRIQQRIETRRQEVLALRDPWAAPFEALHSPSESFGWIKRQGEVYEAKHAAWVTNLAEIEPVLKVCDIGLSIKEAEEWRELLLFPIGASRYSGEVRRRTEREVGEWARKLASYEREAVAVYRYVARRPTRAEAIFAAVLENLLDDKERRQAPQLDDSEQQLIDRYKQMADEVFSMFEREEETGTTLDERVKEIYSPFCGNIELTIKPPRLEAEGFVVDGDRLLILRHDLVQAMLQRPHRAVDPDPITTIIEHSRRVDGAPFQLEAWMARPRTTREPLDAEGVEREVRATFSSDSQFRVRWRAKSSEE